jgi:hypothetical protein
VRPRRPPMRAVAMVRGYGRGSRADNEVETPFPVRPVAA